MKLLEAEQAVLGGILQRPEAYHRVSDVLTEEDFTSRDHVAIYRALRLMLRDGDAVDFITVGDWLAGKGMPHLAPYLTDLVANTPGAANIVAYAGIVSLQAERRRVQAAGQRIAVCESYADAQAALAAVRPQQTARLKSATDGLREMVDALQARFEADSIVTGTPTGLDSLDEITGGWQEGDLIGLGGYTSMGKTALALQCAIAAGRCYYGSLEMMASQLFERVISNVGHIPYRYIRFPKEAPDDFLRRLNIAAAKAKQLPLIVDDQPGLSLDQISARVRQLHMVEPLKLVVIDHMGLMKRPRKHAASELGEIAIGLKNLAKDLRVPVLTLVQLNRESKKGESKKPELEAFRDSGEIEEALDTAVFVHREEYHNPDSPLAGRMRDGVWEPGYAEIIVRKQRQGERNVSAWARSYLGEMRFESCSPPEGSADQASGNNGGGGFAEKFGKTSQSGGRSHVRIAG